MHVPLQCSAFLTRHSDVLQHMLTTKASYLFMTDKVAYDPSLDTGDKSLQCGRLNDALKIWLTLKKNVRSPLARVLVFNCCCVQGLAWWGREVERQVQLATYLRARIRERAGFQLVIEVCTIQFMYSLSEYPAPFFRSSSTLTCASGTYRPV